MKGRRGLKWTEVMQMYTPLQVPGLKGHLLGLRPSLRFALVLQRNFVEQSEVQRFCPLNIHPETHCVTVQQAYQFQFMGELREMFISYVLTFL